MHIRNTLETTDAPARALMIWKAGRIVSPVVCAAPETMPSASPATTMNVPNQVTSPTVSNASSSVMPRCLRSSW